MAEPLRQIGPATAARLVKQHQQTTAPGAGDDPLLHVWEISNPLQGQVWFVEHAVTARTECVPPVLWYGSAGPGHGIPRIMHIAPYVVCPL